MIRQDFHIPVLKKELLYFLKVEPGSKYIDATIGGGGHSSEILRLGGKVLGIDVDPEAIEHTRRKWKVESGKLKVNEKNLVLTHGNFKNIVEIALSNGFEKVNGIIFDLGVSSYQLEKEERGFSFQRNEPLDMRMDPSASSGLAVRAADLVNGLTKRELYELFNKLGDEKYFWAISNGIIRAREINPIKTTGELAKLVAGVYRRRYGMKKMKVHPATKVFQALRIAVNDELNNLKKALPQTLELLEVGGRLVVISFQSLEDKIVKDFGKENEEKRLLNILTKKPIVPAVLEINRNPRARSAKMRVFERV